MDSVTLGRQEQQTGSQEPVCGEARTETSSKQFAVKIGEESGSQCGVVKEARKKRGALTIWRWS